MPDYKSLEDNELLRLLAYDDHLAFKEMYNRYWKVLLLKASAKLSSVPEAEDLINDLFISLWNRRYDMPEILSLNGYLKVALRYQILKIWAKRNQENIFNAREESPSERICNNVSESLNAKELYSDIQSAILTLPEKCRTVFELSREEGLTLKQISLRLGISQKTVEAHINKAIKILKASLRHHFSFFFL